jgi:hypothetical protein
MLDISYCESCSDQLNQYGGIAAEYFEIICLHYFEQGPLEISTCVHDYDHAYLELSRFLELKGYVVTTESGPETIQVRPLCMEPINDDWEVVGFHFCMCGR